MLSASRTALHKVASAARPSRMSAFLRTRIPSAAPRTQELIDELAGHRSHRGDAGRESLRILIVTSEAPPVVSGISKTVGLLHRGLTDHGHRVDIISRADYPRYVRREIRLSALGFFWPRLSKQVAHYDVVNLHGPVPTISDVFLLLNRTLPHAHRSTIVYTHHSDLAIPTLKTACRVYNRIAGRLAHLSDSVVVSSTAYQDKLTRPAGKPVSMIPWGVDPAPALPRITTAQGPLRILFVGQLRPYKGLHVLMDAVQAQPELSVTIVGDGTLRGELEQRIAAMATPNVQMVGRLSDDQLAIAYSTHDVIVLPSTTTAEAYGLVLTEGMASGCVPVASALPGVKEVAGQTGIVTEPGNASELRHAFLTLARDRVLLTELSERSVLRTRELSVAAMAGQYADVFRTAVSTSGNSRVAAALPDRWSEPVDMLDELASAVGASRASLSLVPRQARHPLAHVWLRNARVLRSAAPVARHVADTNRAVLVSPASGCDPALRPLLVRRELTSSILLPVQRTRSSVSVLSLSTSVDDSRHLTEQDLGDVWNRIAAGRSGSTRPGRPSRTAA